MTEKLYYTDGHLRTFRSVVTAVVEHNGKQAVVLASTAFFPTGGGQACDTGRINNTVILQTEETDGTIYHYYEGPSAFAVGEEVTGTIDYPRRFARMQAHSGEHIVSGVAHRLFGAENVGFHMEGLLVTVDFDLPLSKDQISRIEQNSNEIIWQNRAVFAEIYSAAELEVLDFRSKKAFSDEARIVTVEGVDRCACCAPHVSSTGEIGLIKILTCVSHRGGVRITLICGEEALRDYVSKHNQTMHIAASLAAKHNETDLAVQALTEQNKELKTEVYRQKKRLCAYIVSQTPQTTGNAVIFAEDCGTDELCEIALGMSTRCGGVSVACSGDEENGYSYVIVGRGVAMNSYAKRINEALNGRGGGKDEMICGRFRSVRGMIEAFFEKFEVTRS